MATQSLSGGIEGAVDLEHLELEETQAQSRINPTILYIGRRIGLYLITLWGAISASFLFFHLMPGDPISAIITKLAQQGQYSSQGASAELVTYYKKAFGLDGSLWHQYVQYWNRILFHFDFGPSIVSYPKPAWDIVMRALPWTIGLIGTATILGWLLGVFLGTLVGWARRKRYASWITNGSLVLSHIPAYFVALFLVIILAYRSQVFPTSSAYDASLSPGWNWAFISSVIKHGFLPMVAQMLVGAAGWLITTRALAINVLGEDYLTYAEAKGLSGWRILNRYVMRNAWVPQIAALGIALGGVVNGNVLVERLFRYPGVGNLLVDSVGQKDVNTAQGIVVVLIFGVLTLNLIIDLALPIFDPRIRRQH